MRWARLGLVDKKTRTKTLIVDSLDNANLILSSRNVQKTKVTNSFGLNIYDIIYHEKLLISKAAVEELNALLDPKRETGKTSSWPKQRSKKAPKAKPKAKKEAAAPAETVEEKPKAKKEAAPKAEKAPAKKPAAKKAPAVKTKKEAADNE